MVDEQPLVDGLRNRRGAASKERAAADRASSSSSSSGGGGGGGGGSTDSDAQPGEERDAAADAAAAPPTKAQTDELAAVFCRACRIGDPSLVSDLIGAGADVNAGGGFHAEPPLHHAVLGGGAAVVQLLLEASAAPNAASRYDGRTALHYAAMRGADELCALLLGAGAGPSLFVADQVGTTPRGYAVRGHSALAKALLADEGRQASAVASAAPLLVRAGLGEGWAGRGKLVLLLAALATLALAEPFQPLRNVVAMTGEAFALLLGTRVER